MDVHFKVILTAGSGMDASRTGVGVGSSVRRYFCNPCHKTVNLDNGVMQDKEKNIFWKGSQ